MARRGRKQPPWADIASRVWKGHKQLDMFTGKVCLPGTCDSPHLTDHTQAKVASWASARTLVLYHAPLAFCTLPTG